MKTSNQVFEFRTAGDTELSDGTSHEQMINYLAVDSVIFTKKLTVRDSGSRRHESSSNSWRLKEPEVEIEIADDEPPRRHMSPFSGPARTKSEQ